MQVDFPITRHHVPTSTKTSTGGKGFRTLHLLGDHGMHLAERGGLLHLLEAVLHLIEIMQLRTRAWFSTLTLEQIKKQERGRGLGSARNRREADRGEGCEGGDDGGKRGTRMQGVDLG